MRNPISRPKPALRFRWPLVAEARRPIINTSSLVEPLSSGQEIQRGLAAYLPVRWEIVFYIGLVAVALLMRVWELGDRSLHHDESLHAVYSWYIYDGQGYGHNPLMHGPFQFHMNALLLSLIHI